MQVGITNTDENFSPILGLNGVIAKLETMVDDIRKDITEKLILLNILPENSSPNRVRLREKSSNLAGNVLKNGTTLSQNGIYSVYDGKTFCIQILDDEEDLSLIFKS